MRVQCCNCSVRKYWIILRPCQHNFGYVDGRSHIKIHTDEQTHVHSAQSFLVVTHPYSIEFVLDIVRSRFKRIFCYFLCDHAALTSSSRHASATLRSLHAANALFYGSSVNGLTVALTSLRCTKVDAATPSVDCFDGSLLWLIAFL